MTTTTKTTLLVGTLSMGLFGLAGCIKPPPGSGAGPSPGSAASIGTPAAPAAEAPTVTPAAGAPSAPSAPAVAGAPIGTSGFKECSAEGLIDDGEDGNNQNMPNDNRGGYWYTFRDQKGTTIEPVAGADGGTFAMSEGGHGSQFAARYHGKIGTGAPLFGGMGMNFVDPKGPYDASKYAGIAFWAKKGENSTGKVRLKVPDINTDGDAGVCTECFNDFGADLNLTTDWKRYVFPFNTMKQMPGWGNPRKPHIVQAKLFAIQFQVNVPSANYDIYIDDITFICK